MFISVPEIFNQIWIKTTKNYKNPVVGGRWSVGRWSVGRWSVVGGRWAGGRWAGATTKQIPLTILLLLNCFKHFYY